MKTLRQVCAVAVLTLLLSASALAGQVNCPGVAAPPPPTTETAATDSLTTSVILVIVSLIR